MDLPVRAWLVSALLVSSAAIGVEGPRKGERLIDYDARMAVARERQENFAIAAIVGTVAVVVGMAAIGRRWRPALRGWIPSLAAFLAAASAVVVGTGTLLPLLVSDLGLAGFVVIGAWLYGGPVLAITTLALAIALWNAERRSILRMASLGLGLSVTTFTVASMFVA